MIINQMSIVNPSYEMDSSKEAKCLIVVPENILDGVPVLRHTKTKSWGH